MNLSKIPSRVAACASIALAANVAQADTYDFVVTGDYSAHFQLSSTPTPDIVAAGAYFVFVDMPGFSGALNGAADIAFFRAGWGGGMEIDEHTSVTVLMSSQGPQLYTGAEGAPTFRLGTFAMSDADGRPDAYTLTITNVSAVPEPESYAMLLAGIGALGFVAARRRKV